MIGFNHALAGIGIALSVREPVLVAPIALVSHFLLDMVPHFHHESFGDTLRRPYTRRFRQVIFLDTLVTVSITALALLLWPSQALAIFIGALFAMLPDFLWPLYGKVQKLEAFFKFHIKIQRYEKPWGAFVEFPFSILAIALIYL